MKLHTPLIVAAATAAVLGGAALPASAADTTTTFAITGGSLSLTAPTGAALASQASSVGASTFTGTLGTVAVNDATGDTTGWVASAASTVFTGTGLSTSSGVAYTSGAFTRTGTSTVAGASATSISAATAVATATATSGNNTASWVPTLDVAMPAGALAGDYSGTVTTSVA